MAGPSRWMKWSMICIDAGVHLVEVSRKHEGKTLVTMVIGRNLL
ncbi:MAG TPA: hypothetical protein VFD22_13420 [Gemmatimonadaceae bacterium]|nr:hypothetical protein [Gemmatimonadaceae bacterium]